MRNFLFFFFSLSSMLLQAQQFGGNPASLKWRQLSTDTARIIFPEGLDSQARRIASVVHWMAANNRSLGNKADKINIVLQNQTTIANGYVNLGPYRSEFMMTPSMNNFDLGSIGWADQLALHEYRHVQQFSNFRTGASKLMYYLFGEEGLSLAINAAIPDWFYEGDAVYHETVHSEQGRGRMPSFINQYKSLWLAQKNYSWMKLRNGSLKDYVPNHYPLGYLLVNYGYASSGPEFWKKVTQDAAAFKGLFYPFQKAVRKHAGVSYKTFREQGISFYKQKAGIQNLVSDQKTDRPLSEKNVLNITAPTTKFVTNYLFPYRRDDGSLVYLKNSYRSRFAFYIHDGEKEHAVRVKDISLEEQYSLRNGKIVYAAYKPDTRWGWKDYSEIRMLDLATGKQRSVTRRTKYFSPDISEDGNRIAAVLMDESGKTGLHVIETETGNVLYRINSTEVNLFTDPKFIDDNHLVSAARFHDGKMALVKINLESGDLEKLTPSSYSVIGNPNISKGMVYFTAAYSGNDEIYAVDPGNRKIYQVTNSQLGKYFGSVSENELVYSAFSAAGYQLEAMQPGDLKWAEINPMSVQLAVPPFLPANQELFSGQMLKSIPTRNFQQTPYSKGTRLFNFHSWRPYYEDPEFRYSLYGENVLNTFQSELYYLYNENEKTNAAGFSAVFGGLYPYFTGGTQFTFGRTDSVNNKLRKWNQLDTRAGIQVPLNFTGGRFFRYLNLGSSYVFRVENNTGTNRNDFAENNFSYLSHFIGYSQQVQLARQHIFPRFGFQVSLQQRHAITTYNSYQFLGNGTLFLPGIANAHHIVLNGSFQQRDTFRILFSNRMPYSRGFNELYFSRMWRLSGNYHFPLILSDLGFGNILFVQRIRANLFYDFTKVYSRDKKLTRNQRSLGAECFFDTKWWNQHPLSFGFRFSFPQDPDILTGNKGSIFEIILPVSILPR